MENIAKPPLKRKRQSSKKRSLSQNNSVTITSEDMILSILSRLPLKSVMRFKLVSKSWHDMIANAHRPDSIYTLRTSLRPPYRPNNRRQLLGFFTKVGGNRYVPYIDMEGVHGSCDRFLGGSRPFHVLASSKGVLLCTRGPTWPRVFYVCNPLTRQKIQLPKFARYLCGLVTFGINCEVDISASGKSVMHYVVVLVMPRSTVYVFSSRADSHGWEKLSLHGPNQNDYYCSWSYDTKILQCMPAVAIGGLYYWYGGYSLIACRLMEGSGSGRWWTIEFPASDGTNRRSVIGSHRNRHLYYGATSWTRREIRVWVYKNAADHWKLKHTVNLEELLGGELFQAEQAALDDGSIHKPRLYFEGFHPSVPGIIFFTFQDKFYSYRFKYHRLKLHSSFSDHPIYRPGMNCIPLEWSPWPHLLSKA